MFDLRPNDIPINELPHADSHGCDGDSTLPVIFELAKFIKPAVCVIIGSGSGVIPRVIREAQLASNIDNGITYLIDLGQNWGAMPSEIHDENSTFRRTYPEIVVYKNLSVPNGLEFIKERHETIDLLWVDGDHSYEGSRRDFNNFSKLISDDGLIFLHDTGMNYGVDKTVEYINQHDHFEIINFIKTQHLQLGCGFAIAKKNLKTKVNYSHIINSAKKTTTKGWHYLHSKQFLLRQQLIANLLEDSACVLDVGCFPTTVGDYLTHSNYIAVDPLYPTSDKHIKNCCLEDLVFDQEQQYDLVLLGLDLHFDWDVLMSYCKNANRIILEDPVCWPPGQQNMEYIINNVDKKKSYDFIMDFSAMPVIVDPDESWPSRYKRRIVMLETFAEGDEV